MNIFKKIWRLFFGGPRLEVIRRTAHHEAPPPVVQTKVAPSPGCRVLVTGKPRRPNRRPKVATFVAESNRRPGWVKLEAWTGAPYHRRQEDVIGVV
jgi:hypothetical protein